MECSNNELSTLLLEGSATSMNNSGRVLAKSTLQYVASYTLSLYVYIAIYIFVTVYAKTVPIGTAIEIHFMA